MHELINYVVAQKKILYKTNREKLPSLKVVEEVLVQCNFGDFFPFFLIKFYIVFLRKYLHGPAEDDCLIIRSFYTNILHLQYNVFVLYDELKAVFQRPSHDKVFQKHAPAKEHLPQKQDSNKAAAMHLY